jgi:hypothetical protein
MPEPIPTAIVCAPPEYLSRAVQYCPTCKRRRRFSGRDAAWYGCTWTCCACGDSWTDGERHERPFQRGWRKDAIARAKRTWDDAAAFKTIDHLAWIKERVGF